MNATNRINSNIGFKNILMMLSSILYLPSKFIGFFTFLLFLFLTFGNNHPIICVSPLAHLDCLVTSTKNLDGKSSINSISETYPHLK